LPRPSGARNDTYDGLLVCHREERSDVAISLHGLFRQSEKPLTKTASQITHALL